MRVPSDTTLAEWIRDLEKSGRIYRFYKTDDWRDLRDAVMRDHHNECEMCASKGRYTRADTVHHEFEVRRHPHMALTRYIDEPDGTRREVLHPLCNQCHNDVHERTFKGNAPRPQLNAERW